MLTRSAPKNLISKRLEARQSKPSRGFDSLSETPDFTLAVLIIDSVRCSDARNRDKAGRPADSHFYRAPIAFQTPKTSLLGDVAQRLFLSARIKLISI